jgi:hypothetical protein
VRDRTTINQTCVTAGFASIEQSLPLILGALRGAAEPRNVQDAFSTADFTNTAPLPGVGPVPLNVARICGWTWMCAPALVGPNIHANATGYQHIAAAFEQAIGSLGRRDRVPRAARTVTDVAARGRSSAMRRSSVRRPMPAMTGLRSA